ncbi:MAG: hypothetical protein Q7T96_18440 [Methylobacter sp.]|nr:hypothetical protein [Methylobacter sp.]
MTAETTVIKYPDCKFEDFADPFLDAVSETYNLIMDEIRKLASNDESEVDRIVSIGMKIVEQHAAMVIEQHCEEDTPTNSRTEGSTKSSIPLDRFTKLNDKHINGYLEIILSSALIHCVWCMLDFQDGDLPDAIENFTCASLQLGIIQGINSSESRNELKKTALQVKAADVRHAENRLMKEEAIQYYKGNHASFTSKDDAALQIAGKIVPAKFATVRDWLKGVTSE